MQYGFYLSPSPSSSPPLSVAENLRLLALASRDVLELNSFYAADKHGSDHKAALGAVSETAMRDTHTHTLRSSDLNFCNFEWILGNPFIAVDGDGYCAPSTFHHVHATRSIIRHEFACLANCPTWTVNQIPEDAVVQNDLDRLSIVAREPRRVSGGGCDNGDSGDLDRIAIRQSRIEKVGKHCSIGCVYSYSR